MVQLSMYDRIDQFTAHMKPLGAARARKILETRVWVRGVCKPRVEHLHLLMAEGYTASQTRRCGQRIIEAPDGRFFVEADLSKTALDYVEFCTTPSPEAS